MGLQQAQQLRQQEEHVVDKPGQKQKRSISIRKAMKRLCVDIGDDVNSPIHEWRKVLRHLVQANDELVVHLFLLQARYLVGSQSEQLLLLRPQQTKIM